MSFYSLRNFKMMVCNLPAMKGLRLIKELCMGLLLGKDSIS
ncbi:hypothetical protein VP01_5627g1 [Puccinia sorghi]|uniref:Uncharacterized protein n=1 Tax=Puccinia sorghi TaxID=27349 RepID=A0A0L6UL08_9BASI|nr:hypothetical protein VP01_5627g1 [Puccinia sorghi]